MPAKLQERNPYIRIYKGQKVPTKRGIRYLSEIVTDPTGPVYFFTAQANIVVVAAAMARLSRRDGDLRVTILEEFAGVQDAAVLTKLRKHELLSAVRSLENFFDGDFDATPMCEQALKTLRQAITDLTAGRMRTEEAAALINRVVTEFGDDSVQQLITVMFVCEGVSNLMTKELEWGRVAAAYLEQSTRYIYFDTKTDGRYKYLRPGLDPDMLKYYESTMDEIFDLYSTVVREVTEHVKLTNPRPDKTTEPAKHAGWPGAVRAQACDAARAILPVGTRSTVGITMSAQALDALIMRLLSRELPEARAMGAALLREARKVIPEFLERTDKPDRGLMTVNYLAETRAGLREFALRELPPDKSSKKGEAAVTLLNYQPRDERELCAGMLYAVDGRSMTKLRKLVAKLPRKKQRQLMQLYFGQRLNRRHRPGRAAEEATFDWELVGDYGTFRDLQRHRMVSAWEWPALTPYLGYEVPELVAEAGQEANYRRAFELSSELYNDMFGGGYKHEAQYALCMGYRMRYRFITSLRELFHLLELRTGPQGHPGYRKLCNLMFDEVQSVYPISAKAMCFVNQQDTLGELTRMASETATAEKLAKLAELTA